MYEPRFYRRRMMAKGLISFEVKVGESDLHISATKNLKDEAQKQLRRYRSDIEEFILKQPLFKTILKPYSVPSTAPTIVRSMAEAAARVGVGPMAAVAGAIAEYVGKELLRYSKEIIVENGGDIFIHTLKMRKIAIYAGSSPLSNKVALLVKPTGFPLGVCTSSGTVGHSLSFGQADAVVVVSKNTLLADAAATALGNLLRGVKDIDKVISQACETENLDGIIVIKNDKMGVWGDIEIASI